MNKSLIYLVLFLILNTISFSQKPRKIFSALQEKKLTEAIIEYQKIDATKNYDIEDLTLFELSKCLFMIDSTYNEKSKYIYLLFNINKLVI